jgi:thioredoxin 1
MVLDVTDRDFQDEVLRSPLPVVVDFWAPWCAPCLKIGPVIAKFSREFEDRLKCCRLNVGENPETAARYQALSIPLLLFFNRGEKVGESIGALPESMLRPKVEELL